MCTNCFVQWQKESDKTEAVEESLPSLVSASPLKVQNLYNCVFLLLQMELVFDSIILLHFTYVADHKLLVRWFIIGGQAWASTHCWFNVLSCTQTMDNSRIRHCLLFHEHGKQKLHASIFPVNEATIYATHTLGLNFTNCHDLNLWHLCHYLWSLPEANSTTVRDLTVPSVRSLSSSVMICSRFP